MKAYHKKKKNKFHSKIKEKIDEIDDDLEPTNIFIILIKIIIFIIISFISFSVSKSKVIKNNKSKKSKIKVAMCAIGKRENRYLKYFAEFYKNLGYDHLYLYDNNDDGDESMDDLQIIKDGIKEGFISIIKYNTGQSSFQVNSYYDCYEKYNLEYDWISFFDIDEYLMLNQRDITIQEFLDNPRFDNCESVQFNWRVFTDNEKLYYEDKPLIERFTKETNNTYQNRYIKSIIRGGLDYNNTIKRNGGTHSLYNHVKACTSSGKETDCKFYTWPPDFEYGALNHYATKTISEFYDKRNKTRDNILRMSRSSKKYNFDYFFSINKKTKEKVEIFNKLFNTNFH